MALVWHPATSALAIRWAPAIPWRPHVPHACRGRAGLHAQLHLDRHRPGGRRRGQRAAGLAPVLGVILPTAIADSAPLFRSDTPQPRHTGEWSSPSHSDPHRDLGMGGESPRLGLAHVDHCDHATRIRLCGEAQSRKSASPFGGPKLPEDGGPRPRIWRGCNFPARPRVRSRALLFFVWGLLGCPSHRYFLAGPKFYEPDLGPSRSTTQKASSSAMRIQPGGTHGTWTHRTANIGEPTRPIFHFGRLGTTTRMRKSCALRPARLPQSAHQRAAPLHLPRRRRSRPSDAGALCVHASPPEFVA